MVMKLAENMDIRYVSQSNIEGYRYYNSIMQKILLYDKIVSNDGSGCLLI